MNTLDEHLEKHRKHRHRPRNRDCRLCRGSTDVSVAPTGLKTREERVDRVQESPFAGDLVQEPVHRHTSVRVSQAAKIMTLALYRLVLHEF